MIFPRRKHRDKYVPKAARVNRTYEDFLAFIEENAVTHWIKKDTVISRVGIYAFIIMSLIPQKAWLRFF